MAINPTNSPNSAEETALLLSLLKLFDIPAEDRPSNLAIGGTVYELTYPKPKAPPQFINHKGYRYQLCPGQDPTARDSADLIKYVAKTWPPTVGTLSKATLMLRLTQGSPTSPQTRTANRKAHLPQCSLCRNHVAKSRLKNYTDPDTNETIQLCKTCDSKT